MGARAGMGRVREENLKSQKAEQERRQQRSLERFNAPVPKRTTKPAMVRSVLPDKNALARSPPFPLRPHLLRIPSGRNPAQFLCGILPTSQHSHIHLVHTRTPPVRLPCASRTPPVHIPHVSITHPLVSMPGACYKHACLAHLGEGGRGLVRPRS